MLKGFDIELYLRICKERRKKLFPVDVECEKLAEECINFPNELNYSKLIIYIKKSNDEFKNIRNKGVSSNLE